MHCLPFLEALLHFKTKLFYFRLITMIIFLFQFHKLSHLILITVIIFLCFNFMGTHADVTFQEQHLRYALIWMKLRRTIWSSVMEKSMRWQRHMMSKKNAGRSVEEKNPRQGAVWNIILRYFISHETHILWPLVSRS